MGVSMVNRKCVMVKWAWLNPNRFLELVHKGAGAVLILLPQDWKVAAETAVTVVKSESDEIVIVDEEEEEETLKYSVSVCAHHTHIGADMYAVYS